MQEAYVSHGPWWPPFDVSALSWISKSLMVYGALMWLACGLTYLFSLSDVRTLREVGIWVKPMKFMAATALFAWSTVWLTHLANVSVSHSEAYKGICALLVLLMNGVSTEPGLIVVTRSLSGNSNRILSLMAMSACFVAQ